VNLSSVVGTGFAACKVAKNRSMFALFMRGVYCPWVILRVR
jgi:hypothetical protein